MHQYSIHKINQYIDDKMFDSLICNSEKKKSDYNSKNVSIPTAKSLLILTLFQSNFKELFSYACRALLEDLAQASC